MMEGQKVLLEKVVDKIIVKGSYSECTLKQQAIAHYRIVWKDTQFMYESARTPSRRQLEQWMVNYVRHKLTNYDDLLAELGYAGKAEYFLLKHSVLDKIAEKYPFLRNECERQKAEFYIRRW